MRNARLDEAQTRIKIVRRNINNLRHADDTPVMAESGEELNTLLMKVKEEHEKDGLILTFIKRFFSSSSVSAIRVVSSAYLRLLIFLPVCASSRVTFQIMYSACKLNKQGNNRLP